MSDGGRASRFNNGLRDSPREKQMSISHILKLKPQHATRWRESQRAVFAQVATNYVEKVNKHANCSIGTSNIKVTLLTEG